jgi:hypothetical protein
MAKDPDLKQFIVLDAKCYDAEGDPRIGLLVLDTPGGKHQLFVTHETADHIIQELRDFLAERSERLP